MAGGLFLLLLGLKPIEVYLAIFMGAFRSTLSIQATVKILVPMVMASCALAFAFQMKFWNIGAEGQIVMGAVFASYFALFHSDWNHYVLMIVMFLAGIVGGAIWGLIPAFFKVKYGTNETLLTLMFNYIAVNIVCYLKDGPWRDSKAQGFSKIPRFEANAMLDKVFGVHIGWIIAMVVVVFTFIYLNYTKSGYEMTIIGYSKKTARYAGMNVTKIALKTMAISGAICGLVGMIQATGSDITLTDQVAGGVGFTAVIIAWLANLNPFGIVIVSTFFAVLEKGSSVVQSQYGLSTDSAAVLQGVFLFVIVGLEFFTRYKIVVKGGEKS
ncbi:inner-membrane translocator [Lachnospiraceae bacterium TWA4]|nr:inner-membrane translocator [Lachnospiraceae bacterium TWA4]